MRLDELTTLMVSRAIDPALRSLFDTDRAVECVPVSIELSLGYRVSNLFAPRRREKV